MASTELTETTRSEWETFCRADYAEYKKSHPPPFFAFFLSASAYFDSYQEWLKEYDRHIQEIGDKFWAERGHYVVNWNVSPHQPIVVRPLAERAA